MRDAASSHIDTTASEVYVIAADTLRLAQISGEAQEKLGYPADETQRLSILDVIEGMTRERFEEFAAALRSGEQALTVFQARNRRRDGSTYPVEVRLRYWRSGSAPVFIALMHDIAERLAVEQALRRSEERFRAFAEASSDWLWETDDELRLVYVSDRFEEFTGCKCAGAIRRECGALFGRPAGEEGMQALAQALAARRPFRNVECRVPADDRGRFRYFRFSGKPYSDGTGRFLGFRGTATEVSEVRAREGELLRVNRAMTALTRATEALMRASDEFELLKEVCRIAVEVAGYALAWTGYVERGPGKHVRPVAQWGDDDGFVGAVAVTWDEAAPRGRGPGGRAVRSRTTQVVRDIAADESCAPWQEAAARRRFGSVIVLPLELEAEIFAILVIYAAEVDAFDADEVRLLEDLARNLSHGLAMLHAQAGRRRAERELKEGEARYRALVELSPDAIIVHGDGQILFANAAANRIFQVPEGASLVDRAIAGLMKKRATSRSGRHRSGNEVELLRLDGNAFPAEVVTAPVVFRGIEAVQLIVRDITERKQVQAHLVQTAKLATLGEMAASMAHELSQPINIIRMAAEGTLLMLDRGRGATQAYQSEQFALIAQQAERMTDIIDHIRIFSRKESEAVGLFDACATARNAVALIERQVQCDGVTLDVSVPDGPCPVEGRPVQLEQVLINLLTNAHHSVRERRRRDPEAPSPRLAVTLCEDDGETIRIRVGDNGTGIPEHLFDRIFEPFFTTKEIGHGTGLGLSVSFGIIAAMAGTIEARNEADGAAFLISLPRAKGNLPAVPPVARRAEDDRRPIGEVRHVLVVDDEMEATQVVGHYLAENGYRVTTAGSGMEGYEAYMADPADLVITDIRMPKGSGETLIERLRDYDPLLPIIVTTGHIGATEGLDELEQDDRLVVLKKPISLRQLGEVVRGLVLPP